MARKLETILEQEKSLAFVKDLKEVFKKEEIFLVGGSVRDFMLNQETKDFDLVIRNISLDELESFLKKRGKVSLVGKNFGVLKFIPEGIKLEEPIDIALPRKEHSTLFTGGYRDFEVQFDPSLSIEEDLSRRDFTINAMAYDVINKKLIDPFEGKKDLLERKIVRCVGNPSQRFKEDYSRMLRALRMACQFSLEIEKETWQALKERMPHLNDEREIFGKKERVVPYETITRELLKMLYHSPYQAVELLDKSRAFEVLIPEILKMKNCPQPENFHSEGDVWTHTLLCLKILESEAYFKEFQEKPSVEIIVASLFHDIGKPFTLKTPEKHGTDRIRFDEHDVVGAEITSQILERLKFPVFPKGHKLYVDINKIYWLIEKHLVHIQGDPAKMRPSTIEKYFFHPKYKNDLLKLIFIDVSAAIPKDLKKPDFSLYNKIKERIKEIKEKVKAKENLPPPLLNGYDVMETLNIPSSPKVGEVLKRVREEQLEGRLKTKKEAIRFIKEQFKDV